MASVEPLKFSGENPSFMEESHIHPSQLFFAEKVVLPLGRKVLKYSSLRTGCLGLLGHFCSGQLRSVSIRQLHSSRHPQSYRQRWARGWRLLHFTPQQHLQTPQANSVLLTWQAFSGCKRPGTPLKAVFLPKQRTPLCSHSSSVTSTCCFVSSDDKPPGQHVENRGAAQLFHTLFHHNSTCDTHLKSSLAICCSSDSPTRITAQAIGNDDPTAQFHIFQFLSKACVYPTISRLTSCYTSCKNSSVPHRLLMSAPTMKNSYGQPQPPPVLKEHVRCETLSSSFSIFFQGHFGALGYMACQLRHTLQKADQQLFLTSCWGVHLLYSLSVMLSVLKCSMQQLARAHGRNALTNPMLIVTEVIYGRHSTPRVSTKVPQFANKECHACRTQSPKTLSAAGKLATAPPNWHLACNRTDLCFITKYFNL